MKMSEQAIDWLAKKYAREFLSNENYKPLIEYIQWLSVQNVSLNEFAEKLESHPYFGSVDLAYRNLASLDESERRFMLAAIPYWMDVLARKQVDEPEPTFIERIAPVGRALDKVVYYVLRALNAVLLPPMRWLTVKIRAYNGRTK